MSPNPSQRPSSQLDSSAQIRLVPYSPPRISSSGSAQTSASTFSSAQHPQPDIDSASPHLHEEALPKPDVSGRLRRTSSSITTASGHLSLKPDSDNASISSRASSSGSTPTTRRPKRVISVNSDNKTFSLVPLAGSTASRTDSFASHGFSSSTPSGSWGRVSSSVYILEDRESSPATPGPADMSLSSNSSAPLNETTASRNNRLASSPWSWRMRGATMPKIDDKQSQSSQDDSSLQGRTDDEEEHVFDLEKSPSLPPMPAILPARRRDAERVIQSRPSFQSIGSNSTLSERTNYKVYGQSSPCPPDHRISYEYEEHEEFADDDASFAPSSQQSESNYHVLAESSDIGSIREQKRPFTASSDANVILHGRSVSCSSLISGRSPLRPEYSQESLLVAPLRPTKRNSFDNGSVVKSCSGESLRRASLSSIGTSFSQEATRSLFIGAASVVYIQGGLRKQNSRLMASGSGSSNALSSHPHRWSAPLSTVMSESDRGSVAPSRSLSPWSGTDRRSSNNSRHVLSMSSSLAGLEDLMTPTFSHSRSASLEQPPVALHTRNSGRDLMGSMRQVRDYDEHGDGLADLDVQLHHRASRSRLASEHALRHSASTRSLNPLSFPAWARLYYCSGERRFLLAQASSDSIRSLYNGSLYNDQPPPGKAFMTHKPSVERMQNITPLPIAAVAPQPLGPSIDTKIDPKKDFIEELPIANISEIGPSDEETPSRVTSIVRRVKKQTSSIWSPHLHLDRRASRYNIWGPPSESSSESSGFDWLRNRQTVMFIIGFILPFSWIVAAFLPLPPKPVLEMTEQQHNSTSHLDFGHDNDSSQAINSANETRYNTARWWRNLNRVMAIVGLLVIGAVVALIIVGVKQQWTRRS